MKGLLKYILPVALAALFGAIIHNVSFALCTVALTCGLVYFDFFNKARPFDYKPSTRERVFSILLLVVFLGSGISELVHPHWLSAAVFGICLCASWSAVIPKLLYGVLDERY